MQILDSPLQNTKHNLELYLLQLRANSASLLKEMDKLNAAVEEEIAFIENVISKIE